MSAYITMYIRAKDASTPFIELESWCRSNVMFKTLEHLVPYGKCVQLTREDMAAAIEDLKYGIEDVNKSMDNDKAMLEFAKSAGLSDSKLMELYSSYCDSKSDLEREKEDLQNAIRELQFYDQIIYNSKFSEDGGDLYAAYEMCPNMKEDEGLEEFFNSSK